MTKKRRPEVLKYDVPSGGNANDRHINTNKSHIEIQAATGRQ
jgi:hypothetical protein